MKAGPETAPATYAVMAGDLPAWAVALRDSRELNHRGIMKGVQCVCGQWWPDFVRTEFANQFRTECCGAVYQFQGSEGSEFCALSLVSSSKEVRL